MFGFGKSTIEVALFKSGETQPFTVSSMPIAQLPDTFAVNTTMHIDNEDWLVIRAVPVDKAAFRKTGKLQIFMTNAPTVLRDPHSILFTLATISDDLPGMAPTASLEGVTIFHEDDWRQIEFVTEAQKDLIAEEVNDIEAVFANEQVGHGFRKLHLRQRIAEPLAGVSVTLDDVKRRFGVQSEFKGVGFNTAAAVIARGFAFQTPGNDILWGQLGDDGRVAFLNLLPSPDGDLDAGGLDAFLTVTGLCLVDWPAAEVRRAAQ